MSRLKAIVGLSVLCALAFSAISASGASAAGWTAYTCVSGAGSHNTGADCEPGTTGTFGHESFAAGTTTTLTVDGTTEQILATEAFGLPIELEGQDVSAKRGFIENTDHGTGPMDVSGEVELTYEEVEVVSPAGLGCEVENEHVTSETISFTTNAAGDVVFSPNVNGRFAVIHIVNCILAGNYPITGGVQAPTNGATIEVESEELEFAGEPASLTGNVTISGGELGVHHALSLTPS